MTDDSDEYFAPPRKLDNDIQTDAEYRVQFELEQAESLAKQKEDRQFLNYYSQADLDNASTEIGLALHCWYASDGFLKFLSMSTNGRYRVWKVGPSIMGHNEPAGLLPEMKKNFVDLTSAQNGASSLPKDEALKLIKGLSADPEKWSYFTTVTATERTHTASKVNSDEMTALKAELAAMKNQAILTAGQGARPADQSPVVFTGNINGGYKGSKHNLAADPDSEFNITEWLLIERPIIMRQARNLVRNPVSMLTAILDFKPHISPDGYTCYGVKWETTSTITITEK